MIASRQRQSKVIVSSDEGMWMGGVTMATGGQRVFQVWKSKRIFHHTQNAQLQFYPEL